MPRVARQYAVTTGATKLLDDNPKRTGYRIRNTHAANTVYIGNKGVTILTGYPIAPATTERFASPEDDTSSEVYIISTAGGETVGFVEEYAPRVE